MVGIYKITNRMNGNVYVGKSENIFEVFRQYQRQQGDFSEMPMSRDVALYGVDKFDFDVLEECPLQQLDAKESYYINLYGLQTKKNNNNMGVIPGNGFIGGNYILDEKKKVSKGRKNNPNVGLGLKRHIEKMRNDPEYRAQMVEKYKNNRPNAIAVDMLNIETGEIIMSFPKIMDGAKWIRENTKYIKADYSTINKVCKGNGKTAYGYKWQYTRNRKVD